MFKSITKKKTKLKKITKQHWIELKFLELTKMRLMYKSILSNIYQIYYILVRLLSKWIYSVIANKNYEKLFFLEFCCLKNVHCPFVLILEFSTIKSIMSSKKNVMRKIALFSAQPLRQKGLEINIM